MNRLKVYATIAFALAMAILLTRIANNVEAVEAKAQVQVEPIEVQASIVIEVEASAYCDCRECCGIWADKRPTDENGKPIVYTATMTVAKQGRTIAVDPTVIPLGAEVEIDGHTYVSEDTGSAIKGNRVDIYFDTHADAAAFGRRILTATIKTIKEN